MTRWSLGLVVLGNQTGGKAVQLGEQHQCIDKSGLVVLIERLVLIAEMLLGRV